MAEEQAAAASTEETTPQFKIQTIYLKDTSYEAPGTPNTLPGVGGVEWKPKHHIDIDVSHSVVGENIYEVVLKLTGTTTNNEKTCSIIEVQQGGVFEISGFPTEENELMLFVAAANVLFPYIRETFSSLSSKGGFPPIMLSQIDFHHLYMKRKESENAAAAH